MQQPNYLPSNLNRAIQLAFPIDDCFLQRPSQQPRVGDGVLPIKYVYFNKTRIDEVITGFFYAPCSLCKLDLVKLFISMCSHSNMGNWMIFEFLNNKYDLEVSGYSFLSVITWVNGPRFLWRIWLNHYRVMLSQYYVVIPDVFLPSSSVTGGPYGRLGLILRGTYAVLKGRGLYIVFKLRGEFWFLTKKNRPLWWAQKSHENWSI